MTREHKIATMPFLRISVFAMLTLTAAERAVSGRLLTLLLVTTSDTDLDTSGRPQAILRHGAKVWENGRKLMSGRELSSANCQF